MRAVHSPAAAAAAVRPAALPAKGRPATALRSLPPPPAPAPRRPSSPFAPSPSRASPASLVIARAAPANASTAKIIVTGRHVELTEALKDYASDKVSKAVHNYESVVKEIDVRLSVAGGDAGKGPKAQRAEVTIFTHRYGVVRVEDCESSAYAAVDVVCDKVRSKLRRVKEKAMAQGRWPGSSRPGRGAEKTAEAAVAADADADDGGLSSDSDTELDSYSGPAAADEDLIREKSFTLTAMTAAEAAEQADLLGHDFYVYADAEGGGVRVVYKRKERGYGVIVPRLPK